MNRMMELITETNGRYPEDLFFKDIEESFQSIPQKHDFYSAYSDAFNSLDDESWRVLKAKAINHFQDYRKGQKKQGFFNQLNDSFAYKLLKERGYSKVKIMLEDKSSKPDITYFEEDTQKYCEVKTIGISNDEIDRRTQVQCFDCSCYANLSKEFMTKLTGTIKKAENQISAQNSDNGIVFVLIHYDDFTMTYGDEYKDQLNAYLKEYKGHEIVFKIGIIGDDLIYKHH